MTDTTAKTIGRHLQLAARIHRLRTAEAIQDLGLFPGQEQVLLALAGKSGKTVGELAKQLLVRPPTISKTLQRLAQQGLVGREEHDSDARKSRVVLTIEGAKRTAELASRLKAVEDQMLEALDGKDQRRLRKSLKRVARSLANEGEDGTPDDVLDDEAAE